MTCGNFGRRLELNRGSVRAFFACVGDDGLNLSVSGFQTHTAVPVGKSRTMHSFPNTEAHSIISILFYEAELLNYFVWR